MRRKAWILTLIVLGGLCTLIFPPRSQSQEPGTLPPVVANTADGPELPDAPGEQVQSPGRHAPKTVQPAAKPDAAQPLPPDTGDVNGTVMDTNGDVIPGATVSIEGSKTPTRQTQASNDNGFFEFKNLAAGDSYRVTVSAEGFEAWTSEPVNVVPGQYFDVSDIKLRLKAESASITVVADPVQIATEQVHIAEQQRVLGFIPNFYVIYDSKDAAPLTTKLKFQMALKVSVDPVSIVGAFALAGINQAADTPNYQQGWLGYGQRVGAAYADGVTDIMFGGAILPSLLHQDPRYYYQGTGTVKSRLMHALANPFICRGDNGKNQINYSSMGGDLISASISNAYYPESNRGLGLVFGGFAISTAERELSSVVQEFVLRKLTPSAKEQK